MREVVDVVPLPQEVVSVPQEDHGGQFRAGQAAGSQRHHEGPQALQSGATVPKHTGHHVVLEGQGTGTVSGLEGAGHTHMSTLV